MGASQGAEPKEPDEKEHIPLTGISTQANLARDSGSQGCGYQVVGCRGEVRDWRGVGLDAWGLDRWWISMREPMEICTLVCVVRGAQGYLVNG